MAKQTEIVKAEITPPAVEPETFHQMVGAAKYANYIHNQTKSDVLRFLIKVREGKLFVDQGMKSFDEFLNSPLSPMSRSTFYREEKLFLSEGDGYNVLNDLGVSARIRGELAVGKMSYDGTTLTIGSEQIALNDFDTTVAKQIVERLVRDMIATEKELTKLKNVEAENQQLRAEAAPGGKHPYQTALLNVVESMLVLISEAGDLDGDEKAARGPDDLTQLYAFVERLCDAYGEPLPWVRGSWLREPVDMSEPFFQSDAIDDENF